MAEFNFSLTDGNPDELARLNKTLNWLMNNLDHDNITRIYTEYCDIQSELGETVIDGPLLKMTAGTTTLRLKMGKEGSDFVFKLFNVAGAETIGLDSSGNGTFSGAITGSKITGGTITGSIISAKASFNVASNIWESGGGMDYGINFGGVVTGYDGPCSVRYFQGQYGIDSALNILLPTNALVYIDQNLQVDGGVVIGNLLSVGGNVTVGGNVITDYLEGYTNADIVYFGAGNCKIDVGSGDMRLKNTNGAYLLISSTTLIYYDSGGTPHTIV